MTTANIILRMFTIALGVLPLPACAGLSGGPIEGRVLEAGTHKPIIDAIVVARWEGHLASFAHGKTVCYYVLSTTTNEEGRYRFPAWKENITEDWQKNIRPERVLIDAYKPGYRFHSAPQDHPNDRVLAPSTGGREERLEYLLRFSSATHCGTKDGSEKNLVPLKKALYEESVNIASTEEDQDKVETLLFGLESLQYGSIEALNRMNERRKVRK